MFLFLILAAKRSMNKKTFTIKENNLDQTHLQTLVNELIEANINACKLQHLSNWIKNHDEPTGLKDQKIMDLEGLKSQLNEFLQKEYFEEFKISLEFKLQEKSEVA